MGKRLSWISNIYSAYGPGFFIAIVYMLQSCEYDIRSYLRWVLRTKSFSSVAKRGTLTYTKKAILLLLISITIAISSVVFGLYLLGQSNVVGLVFVFSYPLITAVGLTLPLIVGTYVWQKPKERRIIGNAKTAIANHPGTKIAIAGSYGKTSFKEMLQTILYEDLHVAATPGNMNTPIGISRFVGRLDGSEDVLIFELGEGKPGDVKQLCELTQPSVGIITGISMAHMDSFKSMQQVTDTIFEIADFVPAEKLYKNGDSDLVFKQLKQKDNLAYSQKGMGDWNVTKAKTSIEGTTFVATNGKTTVHAKTELIGLHHIGPLVACIDIAVQLGCSIEAIERGIQNTRPFEHRMSPYNLHGATIIDDTYNGNLEGVRAGLDILREASAKRKIYVTPGLVEQGSAHESVHTEIGEHIASSGADVVVLMNNSTTEHILKGLHNAKYGGKIQRVDDPLSFYTNLAQFVSAGDVVLMQNDWTDNYE